MIRPERSHARPPEQYDVAVTAQRSPDVPRDRPDIGAFAAFGLENGFIAFTRHQFEPMKDAEALSSDERAIGYHNPADGTYRLRQLGDLLADLDL